MVTGRHACFLGLWLAVYTAAIYCATTYFHKSITLPDEVVAVEVAQRTDTHGRSVDVRDGKCFSMVRDEAGRIDFLNTPC